MGHAPTTGTGSAVKHHDEALDRYVRRVASDPGTLGVIVTGSLARGTERPDSDVDLYLVVTEERWDEAYGVNRLMFTETDGIDYPDGYFDVKLATLSYLDDAAERGDDPVRASFATSRIVFSRVDDLAERVERIRFVADDGWDARVASFVAQARLHGGYFLDQASESGDAFLLHHAAVHLALSAGRAFLAREHTFFGGPKQLMKQVRELRAQPEGFAADLVALVEHPTRQTADRVLATLEDAFGGALPRDETLSTFILDNELAWRYRTKTPEYS